MYFSWVIRIYNTNILKMKDNDYMQILVFQNQYNYWIDIIIDFEIRKRIQDIY